MDKKKVKMQCPACKKVFDITEEFSHGTGINGVKCSPCFKERSTFVNLILVKEKVNRFQLIDFED